MWLVDHYHGFKNSLNEKLFCTWGGIHTRMIPGQIVVKPWPCNGRLLVDLVARGLSGSDNYSSTVLRL